MTFLICPRWRKSHPPSPSGVARSDHDGPPAVQEDQEGQGQGQDLEAAPSVQPDNAIEEGEKQPESFSHRLRRRFSRESKTTAEERDTSKLGFPFNLRSIKSAPKIGSKLGQNLTTLGNLGSSLMSERAYDSDAQFITTPSRAGNSIRSPLAKPFRRMDLSDLIERSHERESSDHTSAAAAQERNISSLSYPSTTGMNFISTPTTSVTSFQGHLHTPQELCQASNQQPNPLQAEPVLGEYDMNITSARSLPDLTLTTPQSVPSFAATLATIAILRPHGDSRSLADWKQYLQESHQVYRATSSETLPNLSTDILVKKNRQVPTSASVRSSTDPRSIHLHELGIPNRLASQTTASGSMPRLIHQNEFGFFVPPSQENLHPPKRSGVSAVSDVESSTPIPGKRQFSSFYSPQTGSIASKGSLMNSQRSVNNLTISNPQTTAKIPNESEIVQSSQLHENGAMQSKFREHCESPDSHNIPNDLDKVCQSRKVSVGWMSEGRRVGYGYSPVPSQDESQVQNEPIHHPYRKPEPESKAEFVPVDFNQIDYEKPSKDNFDSTEDFTPERSPSMAINCTDTNYPNLPPIPKAKASEYPTPPYLQAILGSRRGRTDDPSSARIREGGFRSLRAPELPPMTHIEHCQVPKSSKYSNQANDSFVQRWPRLSPPPKQAAIVSGDNADDDNPGFLDHGNQYHVQEPCSLQPKKSRSKKWARRFTRRRESRRISNAQPQDSSQSSSDQYEDCVSDDPQRKTTEDLASMYQDCIDMPGSFNGSRWASRRSRMPLWDACTEGLWHSA
ncbi:unnamed protein product [Penicillium pancosmium]